jgi:TP901-1 family phage major tail protein
MAAQKGKDLLLKIDQLGTFVTIGGIRTRRIALNAEPVDITHSESVGRWRELMSGTGLRKMSISGGGVFKDDVSDAHVRQMFFDAVVKAWQVIIPDFGRIEGPFHISSLEYRGDHSGEVTFELALESAGALTFTAI